MPQETNESIPMKLTDLQLHNFRGAIDESFAQDYKFDVAKAFRPL